MFDFSAAIPSCRKGTAWPRFIKHCSWSGKWAGIASNSNCPDSGQKDLFASSQCMFEPLATAMAHMSKQMRVAGILKQELHN